VGALLAASVVASAVPQSAYALPARTITVNANTVLGTATFREQGFLHTINSTTDHATVAALSPKFWRINSDTRYDLAKSYGAKVVWVVSDSCDPNAIIFVGQAAWDNCVVNLATTHSPTSARPVDYWDLWNEPDHNGVWTSAQILTLLKAAHNDIRSVTSTAKIMGPGLAVYNDSGACNKIDMKCFLDYAVANSLKIDALSWHEIIDGAGAQVLPTAIAGHIASARALVAARPTLLAPSPEYHVGEFTDSQNFTVPGWSVAWLKFLEDANVDGATLGCWDTSDTPGGTTYNGCVDGLNGLLQSDEITTRSTYWVHKMYAGIGNQRVQTTTDNNDTVGYGGRNDSAKELTAMVGRWSVGTVNGPSTTTVKFNVPSSYALSSMHYTVYRIPNTFGAVTPTLFASGVVSVTAGVATLTIASMNDGDAYTFDLYP
jgi:hypothetical protein